jgi:hypothetical protein
MDPALKTDWPTSRRDDWSVTREVKRRINTQVTWQAGLADGTNCNSSESTLAASVGAQWTLGREDGGSGHS